jgi:hypothetical protein
MVVGPLPEIVKLLAKRGEKTKEVGFGRLKIDAERVRKGSPRSTTSE